MQANLSISKQKSQRRKSNQMDKICSKLQISVKDMRGTDTLSKSVKLRIQKYIENDQVKQLQTYLDRKVLSYEVQIGIKSMKWNILHFAAKNNSQKILKVILTKTYQQSLQNYKQLLNQQTSQGYTPLMISIIYCAREAFLLFLQYGGSDIECIDNKKMTAYDLALNYKNQSAIRQLMSYSSANGKNGCYVNEELLMKPLDPVIYSKGNCYESMFSLFVDCFLCFRQSNEQDQLFERQPSNEPQLLNPLQKQQSFLKKNFNGSKLLSLLKNSQEIPIESIPIGNKQIQSKYSIQWKKLTSNPNQKPALFDCFQPYDICENNLIIANNLIIFQCLSNHTWLLRKILKQLKKTEIQNSNPNANIADMPNQYSIEMYFNDQVKKVTVDQYIPFLKERQQPMFLSNVTEMWPQILQKGLAKIYGSYMKLSEIKPATFIENLTASYTKSFILEEGNNFLKDSNGQLIKDKPIMAALQNFIAKDYVVLLEGRQGTTLCPKNTPSAFKNYCYTVLSFYEKGNKRLILVNCPYILNSWKEKEKTEIMQLKLMKTHHNSHNQMCVWIDQKQFAHFFKTIIVSFAEPNLVRTQMKIRYLLESEVQIKQQNKLMSILQNITSSAKNIFSSNNVKRDSVSSNSGAIKDNQRVSIKSMNLPANRQKTITKLVFVKFKIQNTKNSEYLSLAIKDNTSHEFCKIKKFKSWIDGGAKDINIQQSNPYCPDLVKLQHKKGEYLCMFEVQFTYDSASRDSIIVKSSQLSNSKTDVSNKQNSINEQQRKENRTSIQIQKTIKKHELLVICWSEDPIQLQHIEEEFAVIDCLQSWRKNSIKNWSFIDKKSAESDKETPLKYLYKRVGQKMIVMTKFMKETGLLIAVHGDHQMKGKLHDFVHEGHLKGIEENKVQDKDLTEYLLDIQLIHDSEHHEFQYVVIGGHEQLFSHIQQSSFKLKAQK